MKTYLLDANLLIALFWPSHQQHDCAARWFSRVERWATCPLTQTAFVRIVSNPAFSRDAVHPREAIQVVKTNMAARGHVFWPDDLSLADATAFAGVRLLGHQQLTDAYLLGLAMHHSGALATLDQKIAALTEANAAASKALEVLT